MHWFLHVFACMVGTKKLKTPNLNPMADNAITWGSIGGLGCISVSAPQHNMLNFDEGEHFFLHNLFDT